MDMIASGNPNIRFASIKGLLRGSLGRLGMNSTYPVNPGVSLFGVNFFRDSRPGPVRFRSAYALDYALRLRPQSVLDVGSGGGEHAQEFAKAGSDVLCVDYGTSVYAQRSQPTNLNVVHADFMEYRPNRKFDLVWASHILEHQRNAGAFIERLIEWCSDDGYVCITVPDPHRNLWGGHVSLWTPGLLAYNVAMCGVDISDAFFVRGTGEFSLFFHPRRVPLPADLTYDYGDVQKLEPRLPPELKEDCDPWAVRYVQ